MTSHIPSITVKEWGGKDVARMTRKQLRTALTEAATLISILSGDVARQMKSCSCVHCLDGDARNYTATLRSQN